MGRHPTRSPRAAQSSALLALLFACFAYTSVAHILLAYPPPTSNLDFLDNLRTKGICGHEASGSDNSQFWRLPEPATVTTTFPTGQDVNVSWYLHYAHQGGFRFELYDSDLNMVSVWNDTEHWGCPADGTQQTIELAMPEKECKGCILRMQRQALEWGRNYLFHSCALVDVLDDNELDSDCNDCSGHGKCTKGKCVCERSAEKGFWYGQYCERQDECDEDEDCGEGGECVDTGALTAPAKQCYCKEGWFGNETQPWLPESILPVRQCTRESKLELGDPEEWESEYPSKLEASDTMTVFYKVDDNAGEVEFAIRAKTVNWVGFGIRAASVKGAKKSTEESKTESEADSENAAEAEEADSEEKPKEGGSGRRLKRFEMPDLVEEVSESAVGRSLLQEKEKNTTKAEKENEAEAAAGTESEENPAEGENEAEAEKETEAEKEAEKEAEAENEGATATGICVEGDPNTVTLDKGIHFDKPVATSAILGGESDTEAEAANESENEAEAEADAENPAEEKSSNKTEGEEKKTNPRGLLSRLPLVESEMAEDWHRVLLDSHEKKSEKNSEETESENEAEAEAEAEAATDTEEAEDEFSYIGEGTDCENRLVDDTGAHPMINQDIIIAYAKKGMFRIQDSFTPSRARPLPDVYFGGQDDITDAVGNEDADGFTNIKFRRKLETKDQAGDYCILEDVNYLAIYAVGQPMGDYTHKPSSSLEIGRASNKEFYGEDELKFHGGGIGSAYKGRGSFGLVDFFEVAAEKGSCVPSTMEGFDCMSDSLGGAFALHWKMEEDGVMFGAEASGSGYVAVAWPENPGEMVGSDAVIGTGGGGSKRGLLQSPVGVYKLEGKSTDLVTPDNDLFEITDAEVERMDGKTILKFKRPFDDSFTGDSEMDMIVAFNEDSDELAYHGSNRGPMVVDPTATPSDSAAKEMDVKPQTDEKQESDAEESEVAEQDTAAGSDCDASDLEGFECMFSALDGDVVLHWTKGDDAVDMGVVASGTGYVSVAWPEKPGVMTGATAVIGWIADDKPEIATYLMPVKEASSFEVSNDFEIEDAEVEEADGKTTLKFKRMFDDSFTGDGDVDLLVAFHPDADELTYHSSNRSPLTLNFGGDGTAVDPQDRLEEEGITLGTDGDSVMCATPSNLDGYDCMQASGDGFVLHWATTDDGVKLVAESMGTGYVSCGWASNPGEMVGSTAVLGWMGSDENINVYSLGGKSAAEVVVDDTATDFLDDKESSIEEVDGHTRMYFTRPFNSDFESGQDQNMIYAYHPTADEILHHGSTRGSLTVNFATGSGRAAQGKDLKKFWMAHGWLMAVGWGALLPIGLIIARTMKDQDPIWFYMHVTCQTLGLILAVVGWVIALMQFDTTDAFRHRNIGFAVMIMGLVQPFNSLIRPKHGQAWREQWEWVHWSIGRIAVALALFNIFSGLDKYIELVDITRTTRKYHDWFWIWLMFLLVVYLTLETRSQRIRAKKERRAIENRMNILEKSAGVSPGGLASV